jgi:hypothetical protein
MWVVLCWGHDEPALWAADRLLRRGRLRPLELVRLEHLSSPLVRWEHRFTDGSARVRIGLPDGREIDSREVRGVLNRVLGAPTAAAVVGHPEDRAYATSEAGAFAAAWLRALGPVVINAPRPNGLVGAFLHDVQWRSLGRRAGLDVAPYAADSATLNGHGGDEPSTRLVAIGGRVLAQGVPAEVQAGVAMLAGLAGLDVMEVRFAGAPGPGDRWLFLDASPYPDLRAAGEAGIEALEAALAS